MSLSENFTLRIRMQVLGPLSQFRTKFWQNNSLVGNIQQSHSPVIKLFVANERNTIKLHNEMGKSCGVMSHEKTGLPNPDPILILGVRFKKSAFAFFLPSCTLPLKSAICPFRYHKWHCRASNAVYLIKVFPVGGHKLEHHSAQMAKDKHQQE